MHVSCHGNPAETLVRRRGYLFVLGVDVHLLRADGGADVFNVVLSAVVEDVLILFPGGDQEKQTENSNESTRWL